MTVEPLRLDLPGGRVAVFLAQGKEFPDKVRLEVKDQHGPVSVISKFNPGSKLAVRDLENAFLITETSAKELLATYWTWARDVEEQVRRDEEAVPEATPLPDFPTPEYGLRQRTIGTPKEKATSYLSVNTSSDFLAVLKRTGLEPDTLLEWDKDKIDFLCCLDLDFHDTEAEKPTADDLDRLGRELSPTPDAWWVSQGGGLKAIYTSTPNRILTAQEFAAGAAAKLLLTHIVIKCRGTVEILARTRHPGSLQKGKSCGPLFVSIPDEKFDVLARFSTKEATDEEIEELMEEQDLVIGTTLDHSYCLIDPTHVSKSKPVYVGEDGLYCHSCAGRLGRGFMSWGYVRKRLGLTNINERSLSPIGEAVKHFTHVTHADYLFKQLMPGLPEMFRRILYRALLKIEHERDARISLAMGEFFFVRGLGEWLHEATLLPVGRPLNATDVSILPSCMKFNPYDLEKPLSISTASVGSHTNNGRVKGWVPIQPYLFEPIFFHHNEIASSQDTVRCFPRVRTTRERVSYVNAKDRMPLAECERLIEEYFPGISLRYVKALMIAAGCAESGKGSIPMLWASGISGSAKTTTISIVQEMYGESFMNLSQAEDDDRLTQLFGESLDATRLITFDDFAKESQNHKRFHTFLIRLNRHGHTYHKLFVGKQTPPVNSAIILTDWTLPRFFTADVQFSRRVHLITLESRVKTSWEKLGHFAEGWWKKTPELTSAARGLHSWVIDDYFPEGDEQTFSNKMEQLGIFLLEDEVAVGEGQDAMQELVVQLVDAIAKTEPHEESMQRRVGRGIRHIDWNKGPIGLLCRTLVDSLGRSDRDPAKIYNIEHLKHVLDPYQLKMANLFVAKADVSSISFDLRVWGDMAFIRLMESGKSFRSKSRRVNEELFVHWPPEALIPVPAQPVNDLPNFTGLPQAPAPEATPVAHEMIVEPKTVDAEVMDDEEVVVFTDPIEVYLDFESQSECNLKVHGSTIYAQHRSTKTMCASIFICSGDKLLAKVFWTEHQLALVMPENVVYEHGVGFLRDMVNDPSGCVIIAHNMEFERAIWIYTLGLPEPLAWYDTMDITLSRGLPAGCDQAGEYMLGFGKDIAGQNHLRKIWGPQKDGSMAPINERNIQPIIGYNFRDVEISFGIAQREGYKMTPEWEQRVCDLHHKVNFLGIGVDKEFAQTLRDFDGDFKAAAGDMVEKVSGGAITRNDLTRNDYLREQLNANLPADLQLGNMRQDSLENILEEAEERDDIPWETAEVVRCRLVATRAALAKVTKALDCISRDGRAKAQLRYYGAATGRWSGYQIQPQNMKRPNEDFDLPAAIDAIERKDKEALLALCKDKDGKTLPPYEILGSLVRGVLVPDKGKIFVVGDFASIEARALLWLAGDEKNLQEYRVKDAADEAHPKGKDPNVPDTYQSLAGSMFKVNPIEVSKKQRGGGKIGILACLAEGTPVLTRSGWKRIETVSVEDLVWDGAEWVKHEGLVHRGVKDCLEVNGVWMTPDHQVLLESGWAQAGDLHENTLLTQSALDVGTSSLLAMCSEKLGESSPTKESATAEQSAELHPLIGEKELRQDAERVLEKLRQYSECSKMGTKPSCPTALIGADGSTDTQQCSVDATILETELTRAMEAEASRSKTFGSIRNVFFKTSKKWKAGITRSWSWIEETTTAIMDQEISGSLREVAKCVIPGSLIPLSTGVSPYPLLTFANNSAPGIGGITQSQRSSQGGSLPSKSLLAKNTAKAPIVRSLRTYDLAHAGPRNRFQAGSMVVHNCGYQGGANAVDRMAAGAGVDLAGAGLTSQDVVDGYRDKHPLVKKYWYDCESAFRTILTSRRTSVQRVGCVTFEKRPDRALIILPSGRAITYMNARVQARRYGSFGFSDDEIVYDNAIRGRCLTRHTYGGKIVENIVQAFCRDLLADVMLRVDDAGWPIAFHVHDEVVGETFEERAEEFCAFLKKEMRTAPAWAPGMPVFSRPELMRRYGK